MYGAAIAWLVISFFKGQEKTKLALKKAWNSFENILPPILAILLLTGCILALLDAQAISRLLGSGSGVWGMGIAAVVGCITLIPGFVAFPLAAVMEKTTADKDAVYERAAGRLEEN